MSVRIALNIRMVMVVALHASILIGIVSTVSIPPLFSMNLYFFSIHQMGHKAQRLTMRHQGIHSR